MIIQSIVVPDRYETLARKAGSSLPHLIERVPTALSEIESVFGRMKAAGRGAFMLLRGDSGSGKSTFLHTIKFFKDGVETISVPPEANIRDFLINDQTPALLRVFVLEEREAAVGFSEVELETWLHAINGFIRSLSGSNALIVWPCNTDQLKARVLKLARNIGGKALVGPGDGWMDFKGPERTRFPEIAEKTLSLTNQSATIADLGLTRAQLEVCAAENNLIGEFFSDIHGLIIGIQNQVSKLVDKEQCRLWILVVAGNEPSADVAGLTRGASSAIDTERLMSATGANIVSELKKFPEKIGIVGTVLDAKILHLPVLTASAICRAFASDNLKARMKLKAFSLKPDDRDDALSRLKQSEVATLLLDGRLGVQQRGPKVGSESLAAFEKLADIASTNDRELNSCIGRALQAAGLILSFQTERDFGSGLTRRTDIVCETKKGTVRLEVMWRKKTGRADVANYTLTKVNNYARAIGFIG